MAMFLGYNIIGEFYKRNLLQRDEFFITAFLQFKYFSFGILSYNNIYWWNDTLKLNVILALLYNINLMLKYNLFVQSVLSIELLIPKVFEHRFYSYKLEIIYILRWGV